MVKIVFWMDDRGRVPVLEWLRDLRRQNPQAFRKCIKWIRRLAELGVGLRRPAADYLDEGVYELRIHYGRVNYRILYCFHARQLAVLLAGLTEEDRVPAADFSRAVERLRQLEESPTNHIHVAPLEE